MVIGLLLSYAVSFESRGPFGSLPVTRVAVCFRRVWEIWGSGCLWYTLAYHLTQSAHLGSPLHHPTAQVCTKFHRAQMRREAVRNLIALIDFASECRSTPFSATPCPNRRTMSPIEAQLNNARHMWAALPATLNQIHRLPGFERRSA